MVENLDVGLNIHQMVDAIADALFGDVRITIDKFKMTDALDKDLGLNGVRRLTLEEIDELCMGEDLGGSTLMERLYPHVCKEIQSYF